MLTPHRKRLGKAVARSSHRAIAEECMKNENSCSHAVTILGNMIHKEVRTIASKKVESTLLFKSKNCITNFKWATVHGEMVSHAPLLCKILIAATKTRAERQNQAAVIGICFAVIMKQRNPTLNLLQKIISLILYSGHSSKLVSLLLLHA